MPPASEGPVPTADGWTAPRGAGWPVELGRLIRASAQLWRSHFWAMGSWFCLGFAVHTVGLLLSAELGARHGTLAMLVFVLGVVATLVALVLMIHSCEPSLRAPSQIEPDAAVLAELRIPAQLFRSERRAEVVAATVGPFLAVYAVWGFVDDQVADLFASNYAIQGLGGSTNFSISFATDRLRFYLLLAAAAWVLRWAVSAVVSRRRLLPLVLGGIVLEALWVFSLFALLVIVFRSVRAWLRTRAAWVAVQDGWRNVLGWLPDWRLPFDLTLPQALDRAVELVAGTVLPGAWQALALPLMWLALTGTVLGWREFRGDVLAGSALSGRLVGPGGRFGTRSRQVALLLTSDLRTKYLPVLQALRLVWRAGPRLLGVYLLLATVVTAGQACFDIGVSLAMGPQSVPVTLLTEPFADLVSGLLFTTVAIAVYTAAFDQALLAAVTGTAVTGGTPPPAAPRPTTGASAPTRRTAPG